MSRNTARERLEWENSSVIEIEKSSLAKRLRFHEEKWVVLRSNSRNDRTPRLL